MQYWHSNVHCTKLNSRKLDLVCALTGTMFFLPHASTKWWRYWWKPAEKLAEFVTKVEFLEKYVSIMFLSKLYRFRRHFKLPFPAYTFKSLCPIIYTLTWQEIGFLTDLGISVPEIKKWLTLVTCRNHSIKGAAQTWLAACIEMNSPRLIADDPCIHFQGQSNLGPILFRKDTDVVNMPFELQVFIWHRWYRWLSQERDE